MQKIKNILIILVTLLIVTSLANAKSSVEWYNEGVGFIDEGNNEKALEAFNEAIKLDPEDAEAWNNKGLVLGYIGKYEEAQECFEKALTIDPELTNAWNNNGSALLYVGRYEEAIESFNRTLEIDPENENAIYKIKITTDILENENGAPKNDNSVKAPIISPIFLIASLLIIAYLLRKK